MAETRRTQRATVEQALAGGWVVRVTAQGRLEWVEPDSAVPSVAAESVRAAVESTHEAIVISAEEQAVVAANRARIDALKERAYPSPELGDLIREIVARGNSPMLRLATAGWLLQALGLVPRPAVGAAALAVSAVGTIERRRAGRRLHQEQISAEASKGAAWLWERHPGLAITFVSTVLGLTVDSIRNAMSVDDTELEDALDAFYPKWSRTDFEIDPRRFRP